MNDDGYQYMWSKTEGDLAVVKIERHDQETVFHCNNGEIYTFPTPPRVVDRDNVFLGFPSADAAKAAFVAHRNDGMRERYTARLRDYLKDKARVSL